MKINISKTYFFIILACLISSKPLIAGELEDLIDLKKTAQLELAALKATGIGRLHPQIVAKEEQLIEIEGKITTCKESHEETVILLNGTKSVHLKGHPKFGKTENALPTLLLQGWKIKKLIPAGENKAYLWLTRE